MLPSQPLFSELDGLCQDQWLWMAFRAIPDVHCQPAHLKYLKCESLTILFLERVSCSDVFSKIIGYSHRLARNDLGPTLEP